MTRQAAIICGLTILLCAGFAFLLAEIEKPAPPGLGQYLINR